VAIQLLRRLVGPENVNLNLDWLALQPWMSNAEGENWEKTSGLWAGVCEGKPAVELRQLMDGLCVDVQGAVQAACTAAPTSAFAYVIEHDLQSLPPSQVPLTPPDTALQHFDDADAVKLMLLGLRDVGANGAVDCIEHGVKRASAAAASGRNPVDPVFCMAADMSRVDFTATSARRRSRQQLELQLQQEQQLQLSTSTST
jgi:hypothetical protein